MVSRSQLVAELRSLGLGADDTVMVHASLRRTGPIEGGAATLIAVLDEVVGTWMMTLGAHDTWSWVNERPEGERAALLADAEPFDALTTPADPDIGVLAEVFRTTPGTVVSDHPEGRFGARGAGAAELVADQSWHHYYGPGSPLAKLVEARGSVLRLGADDDTITLTHHAEYGCDVPDKRTVRRYRRVTSDAGPMIRVVECLDDSDGIVDHDYFPEILAAYRAAGRVRTGRVGNAAAELLDAADYVAFATDWMNVNLGPVGPVSDLGCTTSRRVNASRHGSSQV
jgi:aminoglycoside N3'-acetyltransferase